MVAFLRGEKMKVENKISEKSYPSQGKEVEAILQKAVNQAIWTHKQLGHPIVVWQDGKVVIIQPEDITVEEPLHKK
jgi:hypothetical protein